MVHVNHRLRNDYFLVALGFLLVFVGCSPKLSPQIEQLQSAFKNPPDAARPGVYWYFMDGNISKSGMTKDLEAMKKAGIGSVVFLEVNVGVPRGPIDFLSEEWQQLFAFGVHECERLGIEMTLGVGPGWTGSGGPWVTPQGSMQHLVAVSVPVKEGDHDILLPIPPPRKPYFGEGGFTPGLKKQWNTFYEDVAVLAFPTPAIGNKITGVDEKALYYRAPYSSVAGTKQFLPTPKSYPDLDASFVINQKEIINLTGKMSAAGKLNWTAPAGNWTIMRFVSRNNGAVTRPAPFPGLGFESDKFDTASLNAHLDAYIGKLLGKVGARNLQSAGGLKKLHMDSWEMGAQNWTTGFREQFQKRRGYDPQPFYPVYAGFMVQSPEISERFLWDLRQTSQELVLENHAGQLKKYAHRKGLSLSIEPYDMNPTSDLELGALADVPMCEFWSKQFGYNTTFSCIEAASLAHVNGIPLVQAEAFTAEGKEGYQQYPGSMKDQGDWAFAAGINKFYYHTFQHQSLNDSLRPGMTMGPYGVHWDRNQTWWPMAGDYHRYIARCQYILQQGRTVADILYLAPEGSPHVFRAPASAMEGEAFLPDRKGYNFDGCAPSQLLTASVKDHQIVFPGGASYRLLVLPFSYTMTPALLAKISSLAKAGAVIVGAPPKRSPGLTNYPACDQQIASMVQELWGGMEIPALQAEHAYGNGRIIWGGDIRFTADTTLYPPYEVTASIIKAMNVPADFASTGPVRYTHRTAPGWDLFFIANRTARDISVDCSFRTSLSTPQLWDPMTGETRNLPEFSQNNGTTTIPLQFGPHQSFFVFFTNHKTASPAGSKNFPASIVAATLDGPWNISFDPKWGGPASITFDRLQDWTTRKEDGIKHYSGIATYTKHFDLGMAAEKGGQKMYLDLGEVRNMASVTLNGEDLGVVWASNRIDITGRVKKAGNSLEIKVANLWPNRLIGDRALPDDGIKGGKWPEWLLQAKPRPSERFTFVTYNHFKADDPLLPSGLLGPVQIVVEQAAGK